jgi:hypothetical protein
MFDFSPLAQGRQETDVQVQDARRRNCALIAPRHLGPVG